MSSVFCTTLPFLSLHSILVGIGDNWPPVKSILTVSPGIAGLSVLLKLTIFKLISVLGTTAKFTLYRIGF